MGPTPQFDRTLDSPLRRNGDGEAGYIMVGVIVVVFLVLLALSVAAPIVAHQLRREKEVESERRAEQYVRAIRLYYKKTNSYPPSMDALLKTNNVRFLRQKYIDPLTGKSDWRLIHQPKTKIRIPFGQELSGIAAGLGSAAGLAGGAGSSPADATTTVGAVSGLAAGFGGAEVGSPTGTFGAFGASGASGASGSTGSSGETGMFGDSAGGVIYGVGPNKTGDSILNPNQQTTYETWEFWYDPRIELLYRAAKMTGGGGIGASQTMGSGSMGSQSAGSFGQDGVSGQSNGASGASGSTGSTGSTSGFGSGGFGSGSSGFGSSNGSGFGSSNGGFGSGSNNFP